MSRARCSSRRGSAAIGAVIVLVILQLLLVGVVLANARDQDLGVRRLESVRSFYAAEGAANMGIRELRLGVDSDGDGGVGSISNDGNGANDPQIGSVPVRVSRTTSGSSLTLTVASATGSTRRTLSIDATLPASAPGHVPGLTVEAWQLGSAPSSLSSVNWNSTPTAIGWIPHVAFSSSSSSRWNGVSDNWGMRATGVINIPADGTWTFWTYSDDGTELYINGTLVVSNDGTHGMTSSSGTISLSAGYTNIELRWFERSGTDGCVLYWSGPTVSGQTMIPGTVLFTPPPPAAQLGVLTTLAFSGGAGGNASTVKGFDSALGAAGASNTDTTLAVVATNSTASNSWTMSSSHVYGSARVGVGGNAASVISLSGGSTVTGTSSAGTSGIAVVTPGIPSGIPSSSGNITISSDTTISSNKRYTNLTLSGNNTDIAISGNVNIEVTGDLTIKDKVDLTLGSNSTVTFYVHGNVYIQDQAQVNTTGGAATRCGVFMLGSSKTFELSTKAKYCGVLINQAGSLSLIGAGNGSEFWGRAYVNSFSIDSKCNFYADVTAGTVSAGTGTPIITAWNQTQ